VAKNYTRAVSSSETEGFMSSGTDNVKGNEPYIKGGTDKLSFKKMVIKTDPELVGEWEHTLAEIIINDQPFIDIIIPYEEEAARKAGNNDWHCEYGYNIASELYEELNGTATYHNCDDYIRGTTAVLLACGVCYIECDYPLLVEIEKTESEVIWSNFYNCRTMDYDRSGFPVFRFEKEQYKMALEQLKSIADELNNDQ
jgi:hypothetical protein